MSGMDTDPIVLPGHTIVTELDGSGDWSCSCGAASSGLGSRGDHEHENQPTTALKGGTTDDR